MAEFDEFGRESDLGRAVRRAYGEMGPSPETEARMLAALRAERPRARRRVPRWAFVALPAAACLVLAVGLGVFAAREAVDTTLSEAPAVPVSAMPSEEIEIYESAASGSAEASVDGEASLAADGLGAAANGEGYLDGGEQPFRSVAEQPLSTFSADVDTASYANVRRLVRDGVGLGTMDPGAVRIEEMLNYFDYDYVTPDGDDAFALTGAAGPCPWNAKSELVVLGLATSEPAAEALPSNLVFLVDVSGSMAAADKLPLLKEALADMARTLGPDDRVSIVTYSGTEEVVLKGARGDDTAAILQALDSLQAAGSTNGEAGLEMAYRVAEEMSIEGGVNRIVMASDGDLNVGISSVEELYDFVEAKRGQGVYLSVLGFGTGNYQDATMEVLADHGNGSYHYIDSADEAARVLERSLRAGATPVADDAKLQVEFNGDVVESYRLIGYANRALPDEDFRNDATDAGEVAAGQQLTVAYEVVLAEEARAKAEDAPWLTVAARYAPAGDRAGEAPREQRFEVGGDCWSAEPSADWKLAAAVTEFGMLARDSEYAGAATAEEAAALAEESAVLASPDRMARRELAALIRQAASQTF